MTARLPKVVVVQSAEHVLAAAKYLGRPDVFLLTAPAAAGYGGPRYLKALVDLAPGLPAIIDCSDDPGLALQALLTGWRYLLVAGPALDTIRSAARDGGATVFTDADLGPRLTLALDRAPEPALGQFLSGE